MSGPSRGDCTAHYNVELLKSFTVGEFIQYVINERPGEWGYIGIHNDGDPWFSEGEPSCKYKRGKLLSEMPSEILDKKIKSISADGGWSSMNYKLTL